MSIFTHKCLSVTYVFGDYTIYITTTWGRRVHHGSVDESPRMIAIPGNGGQILLGDYSDVIMSAVKSQITGVSIVYSTVCSGVDQRKHQGPASLAFVRGIHRSRVNSPHKGPVTWKMFPFHDVIMGRTGKDQVVRLATLNNNRQRLLY